MNVGKWLAIVLVTSTCCACSGADPSDAERSAAPNLASVDQGAVGANQAPAGNSQAPASHRETTTGNPPAPVGTSLPPVPDAPASGAVRVNADAATLVDFKTRVDRYIDLQKRAVKDGPRLKESNDPSVIKAAQDGLAARIREARAGAKPGDIFTPEIRSRFRRLLAPELKGEDGRDAKEVLKDDAPSSIALKVNASYPDGAPLTTMPASLLANMPTLPEQLEYRIIGKDMILLDTQADIVVDFIPNAIK